MSQSKERINNICLIILTFLASATALRIAKDICIPLVVAFFIFSTLLPFLNILEKKLKLSHASSFVLLLITFILTFTLLTLFAITSVSQFIGNTQSYHEKIIQLTESIVQYIQKMNLPIDVSSFKNMIADLPILSYAQNLTQSTLKFLGSSILVFVFVVFMLFGTKRVNQSLKVFSHVQQSISLYVTVKFFLSLLTALATALLLYILNIELTLLFFILTFILNLVPSIGSPLATLLPLPIIFLQYGINGTFYVFIIGASLIQFAFGSLVETKLLGDKLNLHPVVVLFSLLFWGFLWGIAGMFLAVPITAVVNITLSNIPAAQKLSSFLKGN